MSKTYVTFGQCHYHEINDQVFDQDCVAVFEVSDAVQGRCKAFDTFGRQFSFEYYNEVPDMTYFPRGLIEVKPRPMRPK